MDLQQLHSRVTREDLLAMFREIYWRGYHAGQIGRIRLGLRQRQQKPAA